VENILKNDFKDKRNIVLTEAIQVKTYWW